MYYVKLPQKILPMKILIDYLRKINTIHRYKIRC